VTGDDVTASTHGDGSHPAGELKLHRWSDRVVVAAAVMALASGFGQFGVVAALGDVSREFGRIAHGASIADQVGLSGTDLGLGLAVIRLASLASLPLIGMADRLGRRKVLINVTMLGLVLTVLAAASPGYWWFVAIFACGRPLLSATNALTQVIASEETGAGDRAAAVAFIAAGYGVGAGLAAVIHSLAAGALGFRGIFALAIVPLGVVFVIRGWIEEPSRFLVAEASQSHPIPVLGAIGQKYRRRVVCLALIGFGVSFITGPANTFVFLYAQDVLHQRGYVTALMVVCGGATGLIGLLTGRWLADRFGRRPTCSVTMVAFSICGAITYSGSRPALFVGYILGVMSGSMFAPGVGSLLTELFPTAVRASVAGWWVIAGVLGAGVGLVVFGAVADIGNHFAAAATLTFLPAACAASLFWLVPETCRMEPEDLWPE
jgi:MFS family permease